MDENHFVADFGVGQADATRKARLARSEAAHSVALDELLVGQRTAAINALRGHAAEFGVIAAKGTAKIEALLVVLTSEPGIPAAAKAMFAAMGEHIADLDAKLTAAERQLLEQHKRYPVSQRLAAIPGVGRSPR